MKKSESAKKEVSEKALTGLILEGGGHRGIFTAGVLDVFVENGILFDGLIGVSAGAIHGASYVAKQAGRSIRYTERYCADSRYMGFGSLLSTGNYFNVDFCYHRIPEELDPFDNEAFENSTIAYHVLCTDIETGLPLIHRIKSLKGDGMNWLQGSASMPLVSTPVEAKDEESGKTYRLLDGGVSDSIPEEAFRKMGYTKNVVILTQPKGYVKGKNPLYPLMKMTLRHYPQLLKSIAERHNTYNDELSKLEAMAEKGEVLIIRPDYEPEAGRTERNPGKIRRTYEMGRRIALRQLQDVRNFLAD